MDAISRALHINDLRSLEDVPPPGTPWPDGIRHLFRHDISTRTTEITCGGGEFAVRMFSLASREDVELAVALAEYVAEHTGASVVSSEQGGEMPPDELETFYSTAWVDKQIESGFRVVSSLIRDGKGPIEIPGPNRSFCCGPRVLLQLGGGDAMVEAIRRVQWIPIRTAAQFTANAKTDNREIKLAIWLGEEVVFPNVEFAGISDPLAEQRSVFMIPASRIPELAGERWTPIDEKQGIVAELGDDWPAVVAAARRFEVTP